MKSANYWKKRMESIEDMSHSKGVAYANNVERQFRQAQKVIDDKIERWYQRLAENNEISLSAAKKLLNDDELEDFHMDVNEYIKKGKTLNYDDKWAKQLENASAKVHISRLEAIKLQIQQQCEELYGNMTDGLDAHLRDVYTNGYYHTAYEIQKGLNVGWAFNRLDDRKIEKAINSCWTNDSKTFKARCWTNKTKLVNELNTVLTQSIIRGEDPQKAINQLAHRMKVSKYNAGRLIMTESAAISSMSQRDCFTELDVEEFEFVATLDTHTSEICRAMDGKHFKMSDYTIGLNAPPLHCFCRSCTVPYFADDVGERIARREDGSTYYVSSDMKYEDWYNKAFANGDKEWSPKKTSSMKRDPANFRKSVPVEEMVKELTIEDVNARGSKMLGDVYEYHRINNNLTSVPYDELGESAGSIVYANYGKMSVESATSFNDTIEELVSEYDTPLEKIRTMTKDEYMYSRDSFAFVSHDYTTDSATLVINPIKCKDADKLTDRIKELSEHGYCVKIPDELANKYVATHEFAHTLINLEQPLSNKTNWVNVDYEKLRKARKEIKSVYDKYMEEVKHLTKAREEAELLALTEITDENWTMAEKAIDALDAVKLSDYSLESVDEFMAEAFTQGKIGVNQSKYSESVLEIIDKYFKR